MSAEAKAEFRYQPAYCTLLKQHVWAIMTKTKQPDGAWRIVNCLDKEEGCYHLNCCFTSDAGEWPYTAPPSPTIQAA